ncbi:hypothetical protein [Parafilimonas sp.]|uniref:hypothetical protein n=1 Tax=Parafilimonas sp. TaxID=1969739 RepID=UPI0039E52618
MLQTVLPSVNFIANIQDLIKINDAELSELEDRFAKGIEQIDSCINRIKNCSDGIEKILQRVGLNEQDIILR